MQAATRIGTVLTVVRGRAVNRESKCESKARATVGKYTMKAKAQEVSSLAHNWQLCSKYRRFVVLHH